MRFGKGKAKGLKGMAAARTPYKVYAVNYLNEERGARMRGRFEALCVPYHLHQPADSRGDPRIPAELPPNVRRNASMAWNHLDAIRYFLEGDPDRPEFGLFTEDDVYLRRDLAALVPVLAALYRAHKLDLFLLGYLEPGPVVLRCTASFSPPRHAPTDSGIPDLLVRGYDDEQWGAQMYMMDRRHARALLAHFDEEFARGSYAGRNAPFNPDWTITKFGRRALVTPMMAVEEGEIASDHPAHVAFHRRCTAANYDPRVHL